MAKVTIAENERERERNGDFAEWITREKFLKSVIVVTELLMWS